MPVRRAIKPKILVTEDHPDTADLLRLVLRRGGYDVHVAANADEALKLCAREAYALLICDVRLGLSMDGRELLRELHARGYAAPAVALTADAFPADVRQSLEAGFVCHIAKPVEPETLLQIVGDILAGREPARARAPQAIKPAL